MRDDGGDRARLEAWSRLHSGYDAAGSPLVRRWLLVMSRLARPLVRLHVAPTTVTIASVVVAVAACWPATADNRTLLVVAGLVVASALLDGLDGAVAVLAGRATAWGFVLDSVADRLCDGLFLLALWLAGAPAWLAVSAGGAVMLLEYVRARSLVAGMAGIGAVTVGERPTRVVVTAMTFVTAAVLGHRSVVVTVGTAAVLAVSVVGVVHLAVVVHRALGRAPAGRVATTSGQSS